ncbi:hypothetical protein JQ506_07755 [Shinella sp. PSBB067]|uniref:hypothetical protein n=1 Tax=Shinella sp. PSBB067 TaxID=2715959 RepID=UPI00193B39DE|nr:hypothetical protein [Shinella sp. PSBB067]QRI64875.1 hypothetical protein JQ506_07755 [Shinella sp. PSBB067]
MKTSTVIAIAIAASVVLSVAAATRPAKAFEVPFDWSCNAAGTHCRAPGLQPRATKFPAEFHKRFNYPKEIVVKNEADYRAVSSGWTKHGDCMALMKDRDYPEVAAAKTKYCLFWKKGYAAPKPKITKGW